MACKYMKINKYLLTHWVSLRAENDMKILIGNHLYFMLNFHEEVELFLLTLKFPEGGKIKQNISYLFITFFMNMEKGMGWQR